MPGNIEKKDHYNLWPGRYGNRLGNLKFIHTFNGIRGHWLLDIRYIYSTCNARYMDIIYQIKMLCAQMLIATETLISGCF